MKKLLLVGALILGMTSCTLTGAKDLVQAQRFQGQQSSTYRDAMLLDKIEALETRVEELESKSN